MSTSLPTVSVVLINHNGGDFMLPAVQSLIDQDYPSELVEVILIDNASTDGSVEQVEQQFPTVRIVRNSTNDGFAPVVNQGARLAKGQYLALLNNDAIADPSWLRELIVPMLSDDRIRVTGGLLLDHSRTKVDFAGGQLAFYGQGFIPHRDEAPPKNLHRRPSIFVCGASMAMPRRWFLDVGGFDDDYFAFVEDVDFGWRTWVLGYEVWFIPEAVATHRHHGTIERFGRPREQYLIERNALATVFKNFNDENLARALPGSMILSLMRGLEDPRSTLGDYRITADSAGKPAPTPDLSDTTGAYLAAVRDFGKMLEPLRHKRTFIQTHRQRDDDEVIAMFHAPIAGNVITPEWQAVYRQVVDTFDLSWKSKPRQNVLILIADPIAEKMAGPAIRAWEMASTLAVEHDVTLASMAKPEVSVDAFDLTQISAGNAKRLVKKADVIVTQGFMMHFFPEIEASEAAVVVDMYDPFHVEALVMRKDLPPLERWSTASSDADVVNDQLMRGDLLLCASERQRDFWLGQLASLKRINPATYDEDPNLRTLLAVAPFGLPSDPPVATRKAIRDSVDGIDDDDIVLLWGGGVYNWFDPATLIKGLALAVAEEPRLKLFFLGTQHPNPYVPEMARLNEAHEVAAELGLTDKHVFFNSGWVDYADRASYLLDADIGVSTHFQHIETQLSFRTRVLDYLWAGLPIMTTGGDLLSGLVSDNGLGEVVDSEDPQAVCDALLRLADPQTRQTAKDAIQALAPSMTWEHSLEPLVRFCRNPRRAPDLSAPARPYLIRRDAGSIAPGGVRHLISRFSDRVREQGAGTAGKAAYRYVSTRVRARLIARQSAKG